MPENNRFHPPHPRFSVQCAPPHPLLVRISSVRSRSRRVLKPRAPAPPRDAAEQDAAGPFRRSSLLPHPPLLSPVPPPPPPLPQRRSSLSA